MRSGFSGYFSPCMYSNKVVSFAHRVANRTFSILSPNWIRIKHKLHNCIKLNQQTIKKLTLPYQFGIFLERYD
jgi:hypothetical protein